MSLNPLRWFSSTVRDAAEEEYSIGDDAVLRAFYGALAAVSASGVRVTQDSALRNTAVLACLIVRAETFSALPFDVYRKAGRYRIPDEQHPVYSLLAIAPNEMMNAGEFWRWKQLTEDITGNAYARVIWSGFEAQEIWPLYGPKPTLFIDRTTKRAVYEYTGDDFTEPQIFQPRELLHFKGPVLRSPWEAKSLIDLISETIGVSIGSEQFFARLLGNGNHFPGYLETDTILSDADFEAISDQMKGFAGIFRAGELRVFDRGLKYRQNPLTMKDAQLVEQLRWQLQQICAVSRVPMAMVQDLTNGTYSNTEQQDLQLGKHCAAPICVNTERVVRHRLFVKEPDYFGKFSLDGLLRGDYKTRTEGEAALVRAGIMKRNEARALEDMNPEPGLDVPLAELNLGTVSPDGTITGPAIGADATPAGQPHPDGPSADALAIIETMRNRAVGDVVRRFRSDERRGRRSSSTEEYALHRLEELDDACNRLGVPFDRYAFVRLLMSDGVDSDAAELGPVAAAIVAAVSRPTEVNLHIPLAHPVERETRLTTDERGIITGKIERELPARVSQRDDMEADDGSHHSE